MPRKTVFQVLFGTVVIIEDTVVAAMLGPSVQEALLYWDTFSMHRSF